MMHDSRSRVLQVAQQVAGQIGHIGHIGHIAPVARITTLAPLVLATLFGAGCLASATPGGNDGDDGTVETTPAAPLTEGFESAVKTAYAAADVTLTSGVWNMSDALIGD